MARVMPGGSPDYTSQIAAREAAANDALTRLFYTLQARREESIRMEKLRRDLQLQQQGFTAGENQLNRDWRTDMQQNDPRIPQPQPSYLAPGSGGRTMAPTAAAPAAPASRLAPNVGPPTGSFRPGPVGPNPNRFSQAPDVTNYASNTFEPDESAGETVTLSGQSVQPPKPTSVPSPRRSNAPVGTTPQPRQSRRPRQTAQGVWGPIDERYTAAWDAAERKYNLPRGLLQTMVGVQHNFGRDDGGAQGWYRMSPDLRAAFQVNDADVGDLVKMTDVMGKNMARNRDAYNRYVDQYNKANNTNVPKLGTSAAEVPIYAVLNQFGVTNGPRVVIAAHINDSTPIAPQLAPEKGVDPSRQLVTMGLPAGATGKDIFATANGVGKRASDVHSTTIMHQENPPSADDENAPIPPRGVGKGDPYSYLQSRGGNRVDVRSLQPEFAAKLAAALQEAEEVTGQRASINNAYRSAEEQAQIRANARGVPVTYKGVRYAPQPGPRGYKAAPPGQSRHGAGIATDLNAGLVRDYVRRPDVLRKHGLATISGDAPHIQLAGGPQPQIARADRSGGAVDVAAPAAPTTVATPAAPTDDLVRTPMFDQRPITQPKTAGINTFGTKASPPLARMATDAQGRPTLQSALAGATMAPKMQFAEESPVTIPQGTTIATPAPAVVPKTAAIPDNSTAAAGQPTPQTAQTVVQTTQAPPAPTPRQVEVDSGYTADDASEHGATRLTGAQRGARDLPAGMTVSPTGDVLDALKGGLDAAGGAARDIRGAASDIMGDIGWAAKDIGGDILWAGKDIAGKVAAPIKGAVTPEARYTDPQYVDSTQGFDEAGMEGVDKYVTPEAQPGEGTRALLGGANSIIQSIKERANAYNTLQAGRNDSRQLEQMYNYPTATTQEQPRTPTSNYMDEMVDPNEPLAPEATTTPVQADAVDLGTQQMQAAEANVQMPPQERESIPSTLSPVADVASKPSFNIPPQVQRLLDMQVAKQQPPIPTRPPLPVEASKVSEAMYDVAPYVNAEGVPSLPAGATLGLPTVTIPDMSNWLAGLFPLDRFKRGDAAQSTAKPVAADKRMPPVNKVPAAIVLPSGEVMYPEQPPQVVPPKRAPAKEPFMPTVQGVTNAPAGKTTTAVPPRAKYDPNAPKLYDYDPKTKKAIVPKQQQQEEPVEQIAPEDEEQ